MLHLGHFKKGEIKIGHNGTKSRRIIPVRDLNPLLGVPPFKAKFLEEFYCLIGICGGYERVK